MATRPDLDKFPTVIILDAEKWGFHTPIIVAMRRAFGKDAAWSAYGYGFRQYSAVAVNASIKDVKAAIAGKNWEKIVRVQRF